MNVLRIICIISLSRVDFVHVTFFCSFLEIPRFFYLSHCVTLYFWVMNDENKHLSEHFIQIPVQFIVANDHLGCLALFWHLILAIKGAIMSSSEPISMLSSHVGEFFKTFR
jgi:hypothetical protein